MLESGEVKKVRHSWKPANQLARIRNVTNASSAKGDDKVGWTVPTGIQGFLGILVGNAHHKSPTQMNKESRKFQSHFFLFSCLPYSST